jgi:putative transcriptional regulator
MEEQTQNVQIDETIHNCVCKIRRDKNVTQEDLASAVGVTRQTIIAIEKGDYVPSVLLALKISEYFNQPLEDIFKVGAKECS